MRASRGNLPADRVLARWPARHLTEVAPSASLHSCLQAGEAGEEIREGPNGCEANR